MHICIHKADTGVHFQLILLCQTQEWLTAFGPQLIFQIVVYCKEAQKLTFSGMCMLHSVGFCFMSRICIRAFRGSTFLSWVSPKTRERLGQVTLIIGRQLLNKHWRPVLFRCPELSLGTNPWSMNHRLANLSRWSVNFDLETLVTTISVIHQPVLLVKLYILICPENSHSCYLSIPIIYLE